MSLEFEVDEFTAAIGQRNKASFNFTHCKHFCLNPAVVEIRDHARSVCCACEADKTNIPCALCRRSDQRPRR